MAEVEWPKIKDLNSPQTSVDRPLRPITTIPRPSNRPRPPLLATNITPPSASFAAQSEPRSFLQSPQFSCGGIPREFGWVELIRRRHPRTSTEPGVSEAKFLPRILEQPSKALRRYILLVRTCNSGFGIGEITVAEDYKSASQYRVTERQGLEVAPTDTNQDLTKKETRRHIQLDNFRITDNLE